MRQSMTAVLERDTEFQKDFETEPYEVAWAGEARWFVQHVGGDGTARYVTQVSPDGITWCDLDGDEHVAAPGALVSWPASGFGHWLRLRAVVEGTAVVRIHLAVKA
ncbi:hypothetical protein FB561_7397 [Kribbella amoyensis]|uniref:Uncharacterized protein n=1 Tax=Kribbella amoyensis TaxID=996641 RepID=A0A561B0M8_9ACTN|nr:hypothetical protein [Kribbella amoyensis]TWD72406.1 hypothetical protein FB561_7397 [Kribbella amoyensis]